MRAWIAGIVCCASVAIASDAEAGIDDVWGCSAPNGSVVETVPADRSRPFRTIAGSTRFSFRAVVKAQPNYRYARGASST